VGPTGTSFVFSTTHCFHQTPHPISPRSSSMVNQSRSPFSFFYLSLLTGINDDGPMHPKSPHVSAPDGVATLMYKMGKEDWLKRFLDVKGTNSFELQMRQEPWQDIYIKRNGHDVEARVTFFTPCRHSSDGTPTDSDRLSQHLSNLHPRTGAGCTLQRSKFWRMDAQVYF
jgi:hypothetical protein